MKYHETLSHQQVLTWLVCVAALITPCFLIIIALREADVQSGMSFVLVPLNNVLIIAEIGEDINQLYYRSMSIAPNLIQSYFKLNTSCISNKPDFLPCINLPARKAPSAKVARLLALCVSSTRSPMPANKTV